MALLHAQSTTVPTVSQTIPTQTLVAGGPSVSIHLSDYITIPGVTGPLAQFDTVKGKFNVELKSTDTPKTATNFLNYVNRGAYTSSIIHRSDTSLGVIQGGGFALSGSSLNPIATDAPVPAEIKFSNTRGTIAMARQTGIDTATSQWFINVKDNPALDTAGGGYTVFGRVLGTGMSVVDLIAAVPVYDKSADLGGAFNQLPLLNNALTAANLVVVNSVRVVPALPDLVHTSSAVTFGGSFAPGGIVSGEINASTLTLKPVAVGTTTLTLHATDTNLNNVDTSFTINVIASPVFTTQPSPTAQSIAAGGSATVAAATTGTPTYQWQLNGGNVTGLNGAGISISDVEPSLAGLYTLLATSNGATVTSDPAVVGVTTTQKVIGTGSAEVVQNQIHPNGNYYDQVLLGGTSAAVTADYNENQVTRTSFIDLDDNIVQVEFSGHGTMAITLDASSGPAAPLKYNQPSALYMKGHASIVVAGADETSNLSIFTVGRATAFDPTNAYNIVQPISATNNPANNGSPLFTGHESETYTGVAGLSRVSISSTNGKFGGLRAADAHFYDVKGVTGIYAPNVAFQGPVYVGEITAVNSAIPVLKVGSVAGETRITGGSLLQNNGQPVQVTGVTQLKFTAGQDSAGNTLPAQSDQGILQQNGVTVNSQIVVNPQ
ncbi:MAG TPA: peptidylprolyl isomerase [Opitutaceae bacterium]|nr:peptidylprolyl isomerase [Opitutaceae bacterium]